MKFNATRYSEWVKVSLAWSRYDNEWVTVTRLQGLGIIDAELYDINRSDIHKVLDNDLTVYDHVNIKSYLWVLGTYELFRMMDQRIRENPGYANEDATSAINNAKREFARLRVPLAKFEAAGKFQGIDYGIPKLGADETQLGWQINDHEIIYYRYLSDLALATLNRLRSSNFKKNKL